MASATEIATRALRRIAVFDALQSLPAEDVQAATEALGAMIAAWEANNLSGDVLPLDARLEQGVVAMLAVRLAEEYGKTPGPVLLRDARDGEAALNAAFMVVPESVFERGLTQPSANYSDAVEIYSEPRLMAWEASTAYTLRTMRTNGGNLYECITAGTSGSTGPTGTGPEITDGTAVWCFRRAL